MSIDVDRLAHALTSKQASAWFRLIVNGSRGEWHKGDRLAESFARDFAADLAKAYREERREFDLGHIPSVDPRCLCSDFTSATCPVHNITRTGTTS